MAVTKAQVIKSLRRIKGPDLSSNIVDLGLCSEIVVNGSRVYFSISVPASRAQELEPLREAAQKVVSDMDGVESASVVLTADVSAGSDQSTRVSSAQNGDAPRGPLQSTQSPKKEAMRVAGVSHLIAVASGKGGVGKSTVAVNLALGLKALGLKVGVLDADIYGPSQPKLLGLSGRPDVVEGKTLKPMEGHGLKVMSMGFMVGEDTPVVWRGPMIVQALNQMLRDVQWGELDVLVIDMPPGTGDVQLTMAQQVPLSGAVIVSTPQDLALIDARKGLNMFKKVDIPVLGIVENMSTFICPKCGERSDIFGHGGARDEAKKLGVPFLGGVPLNMDIRVSSDAGEPVTAVKPDSELAQAFCEIALATWKEVEIAGGLQKEPPEISIGTDGGALNVTFDDTHAAELPAEMLRVMSPSAEVQGHSEAQRVTVFGKRNVTITELKPVGNYATRITFSDGHNSGLFTWTYLDELAREKDTRWSSYLKELDAKGLRRDA